jgi:hypothetical protein
MRVFDTETCGKVGPIVLIQWADFSHTKTDKLSIHLHNVWRNPFIDTIKLIEEFTEQDAIIGFNLAYDWFHMCKLYSMFQLVLNKGIVDIHSHPEDHIQELIDCEQEARFGPCLKPKSACDIMLHARKGPYQSTMDRKEIRIKKIPTALARPIADELYKRIKLKDIYFARKKKTNKNPWQIYDREDGHGEFKDIVLKFAASTALKALATDALNLEEDHVLLFSDIDIESKMWPVEYGYAPFAKAIPPGSKNWGDVITYHIAHWEYNKLARTYAENDVKYTHGLYEYFGFPEPGDDDSTLACAVGAIRWRGYNINLEAIKILKERERQAERSAPKAPTRARPYLTEVMDDIEKSFLDGSTKRVVLEELSTWKANGEHNDPELTDEQKEAATPHKVAIRAKAVLAARKAKKNIEVLDKLLKAQRFHASFVIIGTRSSRMAGGDQFNAQGIKHSNDVRSCFTLADSDFVLCGGDFDAFEVSIADAVYDDPNLRADLLSGKKIHALLAVELFKGMTYEEIMEDRGSNTPYDKGKKGIFLLFYGGDKNTFKKRLGIELEIGEEAVQAFMQRYGKMAKERDKIFNSFQSMKQPGGIGTKVEWHEPADYIEGLFGFKRYFTLENMICKTLYEMANKPPDVIKEISKRLREVKVTRRDRMQTLGGAAQSALYAAAFNIQSSNMRAAANHVIQNTGAQITKRVQRKIWDIQPSGISEWLVMPMNVHDEILCPTKPKYVDLVEKTVKSEVELLKSTVPLLAISWKRALNSWADKD